MGMVNDMSRFDRDPIRGPGISVVMLVQDGCRTLDRAISSVHAQSFRSWELLALGDGSTDGSLERLENWSRRDPRIRPISCSGCRGSGAVRNVGLRHASGSMIAYLDSADEYDPEYLETLVRFGESR